MLGICFRKSAVPQNQIRNLKILGLGKIYENQMRQGNKGQKQYISVK